MATRNYVKHELVLRNLETREDSILYSGPSRSVLSYYHVVESSLLFLGVPLDKYVLSVRMCL